VWEAIGINLTHELQEAGIARLLNTGRERIPVQSVSHWLDLMETKSGDPEFMFKIDDHLSMQLVSPVHIPGFTTLLQSCPTLIDLLTNAFRFLSLATETYKFKTVDYVSHVELHLVPTKQAYVAVHHIEGTLFIFPMIIKRLTGLNQGITTVTFCHARRFEQSRYNQYFNAPVCFGAKQNMLVITRDIADLRLPTFDQRLWQLKRAESKHQFEQAEASNSSRIIALIKETMRTALIKGQLSVPQIAEELGMHTRMLQRILKQQGINPRDLFDDVRREEAVRLLKQVTYSMHDIAFLLGYQDLSSFYRAFRKWTGMTPRQFCSNNPA
jgi:AraC-like DNA-binding protein